MVKKLGMAYLSQKQTSKALPGLENTSKIIKGHSALFHARFECRELCVGEGWREEGREKEADRVASPSYNGSTK